jgi:outer membrane murein-binding lipoprotein Lpp
MNNKIIVFAVLVVVLLLGGAYLGKKKYDSMLAATSQGLSLGKAYGKMITQSNCSVGLQIKYASCGTTECELSANGYIVGCMETAEKDDFCSNVPHIKNTNQTLSWASKTCSEYGLGTDRCLKYIHKYVSMCTEQAEGRTLSTKEVFESGVEKGLKKQ